VGRSGDRDGAAVGVFGMGGVFEGGELFGEGLSVG